MYKVNIKKILDILIILICIMLLILFCMIVLKYGTNAVNEKQIKSKISDLKRLTNNNINENIESNFTYKGYEILGYITIDKIDLEYPILNSNSEDAMKISIVKFLGPPLNEKGNLVLSGHNNYDNTMFAKLNKMEIGDIIKITDKSNRCIEYQVKQIYSVKPDNVKCLENITDNEEITLITCKNGNKDRLIVKAIKKT